MKRAAYLSLSASPFVVGLVWGFVYLLSLLQ